MNASARFTIVGGAGFIGSHITRHLAASGADCAISRRQDTPNLRGALGHVIYCAGTTSDFRQRPFDTVEAHVSELNRILRDCEFLSLTYFSSTRLYIHSPETAETAFIRVQPNNPEDLFNLSKLAGESLCLNSGRPNVRVIRVSNVLGEDFGSSNFVFDVMRAARDQGRIVLRSGLDSEKDYVLIEDVVALTPEIARRGKAAIYNLASGSNVTNRDIIAEIRAEIPAGLEVAAGSPDILFQPIDTDRIATEFGFRPRPVLPQIRALAAKFRALPGD